MAGQFSHGKKWDFSFPCLEFCHCEKNSLIFSMHSSHVVPKGVSDLPKYNLLWILPSLSDYIEKKEPQFSAWGTRDLETRNLKCVKL